MNATSGVAIIMVAVLGVYLVWKTDVIDRIVGGAAASAKAQAQNAKPSPDTSSPNAPGATPNPNNPGAGEFYAISYTPVTLGATPVLQ